MGAQNVVGTKHVMENADSALMMLYRNYIVDYSGRHQPDSSIVSRLKWFLTYQCEDCLKPEFQPKATIQVMVESSCKMGRGCTKLSFCAYDADYLKSEDEIPQETTIDYLYNTLEDMHKVAIQEGLYTEELKNRLF